MAATVHLMQERLDRCESDAERIAEGLRSVGRCYRYVAARLSQSIEGSAQKTAVAIQTTQQNADKAARLATLVQMVLDSGELDAITYLRDCLADAKMKMCSECGPSTCPLHSLCELADRNRRA